VIQFRMNCDVVFKPLVWILWSVPISYMARGTSSSLRF
jgi:hypothetical protein